MSYKKYQNYFAMTFTFLTICMFEISCDPKSSENISDANSELKDLCDTNLKKVTFMDDRKEDLEIQVLIEPFKRQPVKDYVYKIVTHKGSAFTVFASPSEYRNVVKAGKIVVPYLIPLLEDESQELRVATYMALTEITNKRFGSLEDFYNNLEINQKRREKAIVLWRKWWEDNKTKTRTQWFIDDLSGEDEVNKKEAAIALGSMGDKSAIPPLRTLLDEPKFAFYVAESLARLDDGYSIPFIIKLHLTHDMEGYRRNGLELLESVTGQTLGFNPQVPQEERDQAIERWLQWWENNKNKYLDN
ncbi:MAG: HEAT repeat domain-containing protein [Planctomycetota bacterium]|jgi:HEAT repeat protein